MDDKDFKIISILDQSLTSYMEGHSSIMMLYDEIEDLLMMVSELKIKNHGLCGEIEELKSEIEKLKEVETAAKVFLSAVNDRDKNEVSSGLKKLHTAIHKDLKS